MERTEQDKQYISQLVINGIDGDTDPILRNAQAHTVLDAYCMLRDKSGVYTRMEGESNLFNRGDDDTYMCAAMAIIDDKVFEIQRKSSTIYIYYDDTLIAESGDLPGASTTELVDIQVDEVNNIIYLNDGAIAPIALDLQDMIDNSGGTKYKADYDAFKYRLQAKVQHNVPKCIGLSNLGSGGGLRVGSYAYSVRYGTFSGEYSPWSPSSPMIPVPRKYIPDDYYFKHWFAPGNQVFGGPASQENSSYGIRLLLRITNIGNYDFIELRRVANYDGASVEFTGDIQHTKLVYDANGNAVDIKADPYGVVEFIDSGAIQWNTLPEEDLSLSGVIKNAQNLRLTEGRIVLGGIEYESKIISSPTDIFLEDANNDAGVAIKQSLGEDGYLTWVDQVYNKTLITGEKYGWGVLLYDLSGNPTYVIPWVSANDDLSEYQVPDRRDEMNATVRSYSSGEFQSALKDSYAGISVGYCYDILTEPTNGKSAYVPTPDRCISPAGVGTGYFPFTPTGGYDGFGSNYKDRSEVDMIHMAEIEGSYDMNGYGKLWGNEIMTTKMRFEGIDVSNLPSWAAGFSVVRTAPAGRVVANGLGMYALEEQGNYDYTPALQKSLNKLWVHLPDADPDDGIYPNIYDDIIENPTEYKLQLVSPLGFFSEVFSGYNNDFTVESDQRSGKVDLVSYPRFSYEGGDCNPMDSTSDIGQGDGYVAFGHYRNEASLFERGSGIGPDPDHILDITDANYVDINGKNGRSTYLEITVDGNIYYYTDIDGGVGKSGDDNNARQFHEPFYSVHILQTGKTVSKSNVVSYKEIGQYIKLKSLIGVGNGEDSQTYTCVDERYYDFFTLGVNYRYLWINDQRWLDVTGMASGTIDGYRSNLETQGYFTGPGGQTCYGIYRCEVDTGLNTFIIIFDYDDTGGTPVVPAEGDEVEIRYNEAEQIESQGDAFVSNVNMGVIDTKQTYEWPTNSTLIPDSRMDSHFRLYAPMPFHKFEFVSDYIQPDDPEAVSDQQVAGGTYYNHYLRQWVMNYFAETRTNYPFAYSDVFPKKNYVIRPNHIYIKSDDQTEKEFLEAYSIFASYADDYPEEYLNWGYGGMHYKHGLNTDYSKRLPFTVYAKPQLSIEEQTTYPKRIQWSTDRMSSLVTRTGLRMFPITNVYDLSTSKAGNICFLYDAESRTGRNLYAITECGVALLYTNKIDVYDAIANNVGVTEVEGSFIVGERFLSTSVGCGSRHLGMGRGEGLIRGNDNRLIEALYFPSYHGPILFYDNTLINLITNWRDRLEGIFDYGGTYVYQGVFHERRNELWIVEPTQTFVFNFDINNWAGRMNIGYDYAVYTKGLDGVSPKGLAVGSKDFEVYYNNPDVNTIQSQSDPDPYIKFLVNPGYGSSWEFMDIKVMTEHNPKSIWAGVNDNDSVSLMNDNTKFRDFKPGYYLHIARITSGTDVGDRLQGDVAEVRVVFDGSEDIKHKISGLLTGVKKILG